MSQMPICTYFSINGIIKPVSDFVESENNGGVYEVIRVCKSVPLFLEDHLSRFYKSSEIAKIEVPYKEQEIGSFLRLLIQKNSVDTGNFLISYKSNLKIFQIAHKYPTRKNYSEGVKCGLLFAKRINPNAKVFQTTVRQRANKTIAENGFYEVLLVDDSGRITEGSRSNVFFIKGNQIVTPSGEGVLLGITRQKTIGIIKMLGIDFFEKDILLSELSNFDAIFITGTSPKILPLKQVGEIHFNPQNVILQSIIKQYDLLVDQYTQTK